MFAEKKQINHKNQKNPVPKGTLDSSLKKTNKPEISNSFFQRIISLLKKEELIWLAKKRNPEKIRDFFFILIKRFEIISSVRYPLIS